MRTILFLAIVTSGLLLAPWAQPAIRRNGFQAPETASDSLPIISGPTVIAVIQNSSQPPQGILDQAQRTASALGYRFIVLRQPIPRYLPAYGATGRLHYDTAIYTPSDTAEGYAVVNPARSPEFVQGLASTADLKRELRASLRAPLANWYFDLWPLALASFGLLLASLTPIIQQRSTWIFLSLLAIGLSIGFELPIILGHAANPFNNLLTRDVVSLIALTLSAPLLVALTSRWLSDHKASLGLRLIVPAAMASAVLGMSPIYAFLVHCTSGDCL